MNKKYEHYVVYIGNNENTKSFKPENKAIEHLLSNVKTYEDKNL